MTTTQLNRWLGALKIPKNQLERVRTFVSDTIKWWSDNKKNHPEQSLERLASQWGLPCKKVPKLDTDALLTVMAAACFYAD